MKRPILYCAVSLIAGIMLAYFFNIPVVYFFTASFIFISAAAVLFKKGTISHTLLYIALVFFGAVYYQSYNILPNTHIANFITSESKAVSIQGVVIDDPVIRKAFYGREREDLLVRAELLAEDDHQYDVTGLVKVSVYTEKGGNRIKFGDRIVAKGSISRPKGLKNPGLFDYSKYLKIKNIYAVMNVGGLNSISVVDTAKAGPVQLWASRLRNKIIQEIDRYTDSRYSGFLKAILVGERSELDNSVLDDFISTGTVHVIAISGLNIVLIAGIFFFVFKLFGVKKKLNLALTSALLVFYCFVAGASAPVVRATIMFLIVSFGYIIERESDILNSLAIAAFAILLWNPNELFDPSFQLSFASILGIVIFSPKIEAAFFTSSNFITKSVAVSVAAMIAVSPIVSRYFNIVSPVAIIANLVIVPALFVITIASFVFLFLELAGLKFLLIYAGYALSFLTNATFYINHLFAQLPFAYLRIPAASVQFLFAYYGFIFLFLFSKRKKELLAALLIVINIFLWADVLAENQDRNLKITVLDVGGGDSILIEFPNGSTMLIDAGPGGVEGLADTGRSVVAPYLWNRGIRRIDAVVGTHFHSDHFGGLLYVLKNFGIGCVMDNGIPPESGTRLYDSYRRIILARSLRRLTVHDGDELTGFGAVKLFVLNPPEGTTGWSANDNSIAIKLEYKNFSALLCADISEKSMENMFKYKDLLRADLLKIPHHGGSTGKAGLTEIFMEKVTPKVSIISSGKMRGKKYYSDTKTHEGSIVYDTLNNGAVEVITDGLTYTVKSYSVIDN